MSLLMVLVTPKHDVEPGWSNHAETHLRQGVWWLVGLCLVSLVIVTIPLGRGERWAWWTLLLSGAVLFGGYFGPYLMLYRRLPGVVDTAGLGILLVVFGVGSVSPGAPWVRHERLLALSRHVAGSYAQTARAGEVFARPPAPMLRQTGWCDVRDLPFEDGTVQGLA